MNMGRGGENRLAMTMRRRVEVIEVILVVEVRMIMAVGRGSRATRAVSRTVSGTITRTVPRTKAADHIPEASKHRFHLRVVMSPPPAISSVTTEDEPVVPPDMILYISLFRI